MSDNTGATSIDWERFFWSEWQDDCWLGATYTGDHATPDNCTDHVKVYRADDVWWARRIRDGHQIGPFNYRDQAMQQATGGRETVQKETI